MLISNNDVFKVLSLFSGGELNEGISKREYTSHYESIGDLADNLIEDNFIHTKYYRDILSKIPVNDDLVTEAYNVILERAPETVEVVREHVVRHKSSWHLLSSFSSSEEYRGKVRSKRIAKNLHFFLSGGRRVRALLFGAYGNGNLGDAIQADYLRSHLERVFPYVEVWATTCFSKEYNFPQKNTLPSEALFDPRIGEYFDVLLIGGGGLLAHPHEPLGNIEWIREVKLPIAIISVGANGQAAEDAEELIKKASFVSGRDSISVGTLGLYRNNPALMADPVLMGPSILVSRSSDRDGIAWILKGPIEPTHFKIQELMQPNDIVLCFEPDVDTCLESIYPSIHYVDSVEVFSSLISGKNSVVSMRYHGVILSLLSEIPVRALGDIKIRSLFEWFGRSDLFIEDLSEFDRDFDFRFEDFAEQLMMEKLKFECMLKESLGDIIKNRDVQRAGD